jgi:hypothetical protein
MGNLTAEGDQLWVSGRYNYVVYVVSATDLALLHTINVGSTSCRHHCVLGRLPRSDTERQVTARSNRAHPRTPGDTRAATGGRRITLRPRSIGGSWPPIRTRSRRSRP